LLESTQDIDYLIEENNILKNGIAEIFNHLAKVFGSKKCACFDPLACEPCESHVFLASYAAKFEEAKKLRDVQLSKKDLPA
jgi:hypothetical protein